MSVTLQLINVPGYTGSGPDHWQSIWERHDPTILRVEQQDWNRPDIEEWPRALQSVVSSARYPVIFVAHSCGVTAVALWAARYKERVGGAFLVAPADPLSAPADAVVRAFGPVPLIRLGFPALVVASDDDPYCSVDRARDYARAWAADLVVVPRAGHINTASGHGPWPEGRRLLDQFCDHIRAGAPADSD